MTTARDMVRDAMVELAILPSGGEAEADEYVDGIMRLNEMLATWAGDHAMPWSRGTVNVVFAAGDVGVELPASVQGVAWAKVGPRTLMRCEADDYHLLPNSTAGHPVQYRISDDETKLMLWPKPSAAVTVELGAYLAPETLEGSDIIPAPQKWHETIRICLAKRLIGMFGSVSQEAAALVMARAEQLERLMYDKSRPDYYFAEPDFSAYA